MQLLLGKKVLAAEEKEGVDHAVALGAATLLVHQRPQRLDAFLNHRVLRAQGCNGFPDPIVLFFQERALHGGDSCLLQQLELLPVGPA
jgi:hypothetical protein